MTTATNEQGGARVRIPPPLVYLVSIVAGVALRYVVAPPRPPLPRAVEIAAGALIAIAGLAFGGAAFGLFKRAGQDPTPWKPKTSLVIEGVYKISRNPMYVGMTLLQIGIGIALANLWIVLLAALSLVIVHVTAVLPEEAFLTEKFGDGYRHYKATVRRYL